MTFAQLYRIIYSRKRSGSASSYVASLFRDGSDRMLQKVGEEASEVLIAAKNTDRQRQIEEISDLIFHVLVLLVSLGIPLSDILKELEQRHDRKT